MTELVTLATIKEVPLAAAGARLEHDLLGEREIPGAAYWGVHTLRALENFPITKRADRSSPSSSRRWPWSSRRRRAPTPSSAYLRGRRPSHRAACDAIIDGQYHDQFVVDADPGRGRHLDQHERERGDRQPGARAHRRGEGDYAALHPNDDVNMAQSTNDAYPTALKLAIILAQRSLLAERSSLAYALTGKAAEFATS